MSSIFQNMRWFKLLALTVLAGLLVGGIFKFSRSSARQEVRKLLRSNATAYQARGLVKFLKHPDRYPGDCDGLVLDRIDLGGRQLRSLEIRNCDFSATRFDSAEFVDCIFKDCIFDQCDLRRAVIKNSIFEGCIFSSANFAGASFQDTDLSSSTFSGAQLELEQIQGLKGLESAVFDDSLREALESK